jgi:hypothetical protein
MKVRQAVAMLALVAAAASSAARADTIFNVTATYEPFQSANTTFEIDNVSGAALTGVDISSGTTHIAPFNIAAGGSFTYSFDGQLGGPFQQAPGGEGLPDTTEYQVSATVNGQLVSSSLFSSVTNLTGTYIDFLGACFTAQTGCSQDPAQNYPTTGLVADGVSAVPLPAALPLLLTGLLGLGRRLARRSTDLA